MSTLSDSFKKNDENAKITFTTILINAQRSTPRRAKLLTKGPLKDCPLLLLAMIVSLAFQAHELTAQSDSSERRIAGFEEALSPFAADAPAKVSLVSEHATEGRNALRWEGSYLSLSGSQDWSSFDQLAIDFYNPQESPLQLWLEVKDVESKGYWTRVNHPIVVAPGRSTIRIPTRLYVGEKARPGRALITNRIRSVILSRAEDNNETLFMDNVRLIKEQTFVPDPRVLAFDFGTETSPLFGGMKRVSAATQYSAEQGFGLRNAKLWTPYRQASDALQPDSLYRDCIMIRQGEFVVDLPSGAYLGFMNIDHPGGYWGEYPKFKRRRVFAEGRLIIDEGQTYTQALQRYFRFFNFEDRPDESFFDKYLSAIFSEKKFEVFVNDNQLTLSFPETNCVDGDCFGMALSTLVLAPRELEQQFDQYLTEIRRRRKIEFDAAFHFVAPPQAELAPATTELSLFTRPYYEELPPDQAPDPQRDLAKIELHATPGESEPLNFLIHAAHDTDDLSISLSDFSGPTTLPASIVTLSAIDHRISRVTTDGSLYTVAERYLRPRLPQVLAKGRSLRIWGRASVPPTAPPGEYRSLVQVAARNQPVRTLAVLLKVLPFALQPMDLAVGPFNNTVQENFWFPGENAPRALKLRELSLRKMREIGLTTFSVQPHMKAKVIGGQLSLDSAAFEAQIERAVAMGFQAVVGYMNVLDNLDLSSAQLADTLEISEEEFLRLLAESVARRAQLKKWPPLFIIIGDEPLSDDAPQIARRVKTLNNFSSPGVRYTVAYSATAKAAPIYQQMAQEMRFSLLNSFAPELLPKENDSARRRWGFYNRASRSTFGFYLYRLRRTTALDLRIAWNWNQNLADPYFGLDAREEDYNWCNSTPEGELLCTVFLEREIGEGIDDYRYALTLERALAGIREEERRREGEKLLAEVMNFEDGTEPIAGKTVRSSLEAAALRAKIISFLEVTFKERKQQ